MKKFGLIAVALVVAGAAFASSLCVPWFIDSDQSGLGLPPNKSATEGIVYLHNNLTATLNCQIEYLTNGGLSLGPEAPFNTFAIPPRATMAFRPGCNDASGPGNTLGQEPVIGSLVPDRPYISSIENGMKKNGSIVINWVGGSGDCQGIYLQTQNVDGTRLLQYGTLLPPGV